MDFIFWIIISGAVVGIVTALYAQWEAKEYFLELKKKVEEGDE